jgi:hypothetical protein
MEDCSIVFRKCVGDYDRLVVNGIFIRVRFVDWVNSVV